MYIVCIRPLLFCLFKSTALVMSIETRIADSFANRPFMFLMCTPHNESPFISFAHHKKHPQNGLDSQIRPKRKIMSSSPPTMTTTCIRGLKKQNRVSNRVVTIWPCSYAIATKDLLTSVSFSPVTTAGCNAPTKAMMMDTCISSTASFCVTMLLQVAREYIFLIFAVWPYLAQKS